MRHFLNKSFSKKLKKEIKNEKISKKDYAQELFDNFYKYKKCGLGSKLHKVRVAREGKGKSGGYRNIVFWEHKKFVIAVFIFGKGDKNDLTDEEFSYLKVLAHQYEKFTEDSINKAVKENSLEEIDYEQKKK